MPYKSDFTARIYNDDIKNHTLTQLDQIYSVTEGIIENLDEYAINEILTGNFGDIDNLFKIITEEAEEVLLLNKTGINLQATQHLPAITNSLDDFLKKKSLSYFISTTLPSFEMEYFHIEWANFVQMYRLLCVVASRGIGKTIKGDTKVVMFDGSLKEARDIIVGDLLMGIDNTPRKVLNTHICEDKAYLIDQSSFGTNYIVNSRHILHFKRNKCCFKNKGWCSSKEFGENIVEMSAEEFYKKGDHFKSQCFGYRVNGWELPEKDLPIDPYILGTWLGDGNSHRTVLTNIDSEIIKQWESYAEKNDLTFHKIKSQKYGYSITHKKGSGNKNTFLEKLEELNIRDNKHIPEIYLTGSKAQRLELLAGIIDTDGHLCKKSNRFEVTLKSGSFVEQVRRLCWSLGFRATMKKRFVNGFHREELGISIDIHTIPTRVKHKQAKKVERKQDPRRGKLGIKEIGRDTFYGFELDGDHLHLIEDGTVLHNSFFFSWAHILWKLYRYDSPTTLRPNIPLEIKLCKEGMLITNEYKLAKRLLKKVKDEIEVNDILARKLLPDSKGDGWGLEMLRTKNGAELALSSFGTSNRGPHPGWIQLDDFLDKSALYSNEQREKFWEVFSAEITNMLMPGGSFNVVGTPFHSMDLYAKLKLDPQWKVFEYPAIMPTGETLSHRFPFKDLMNLRKSLGSLIFTREILVRPISDQASIFPYTILNNAIVGMQNIRLVDNIHSYPIKFKKVSVGVDFAISANIAADFTVMTVWGLSSLDEYYLLHIFRGQGLSHSQQISELQRIDVNFQPDVIIAEANGFQRVMIQLAKDAGIRKIQEFITTGFNKKDLYEGLPALAVLFERSQIKIPYGDEKSKNLCHLILQEFNSITFSDDTGKLEASAGHDDIPMSSHFGIKGINQVNTQMNISLI